MRILIISTGDELLKGYTLDTNAGWIAAELCAARLTAKRIVVAGDDLQDLSDLFRRSFEEYDLVIVSGGLGPTDDDLTAEAAAIASGRPVWTNEIAKSQIEAYFEQKKRPIGDINLKQAELPEGAIVLDNRVGTAPGFSLEVGKARAYFLPGVPSEMKAMFTRHLLPSLPHGLNGPYEEVFMCFGMGESNIQQALRPVAAKWPKLRFSFRTSFMENCVTVRCDNKEIFRVGAEATRDILGDAVYSNERIGLAEALGRALDSKAKTLGTAESCTGGLIAHELTQIPGASCYFLGGVVCYDNEQKVSLLKVDRASLESSGAVSEPVVRQMAQGAKKLIGSDYAIATSGIAGPSGGTEEKPGGLVHIAVAYDKGVLHKRCQFTGYDRQKVKRASAQTAMRMTLDLVTGD